MKRPLISPSLLSADFLKLGEDIDMLNRSDADWLHLDIMDGKFVPNISYGFPVIEAIAKVAKKPLDAHFMIVEPERYIQRTAELGVMMMSVHIEATTHLHRTVQEIHAAGMKAGVTLNPATPLSMVEDIVGEVDMVLLMSVNPGFGGQKFIEHAVRKTARLRELLDRQGSNALIEIDGGVTTGNAARLVEAGADVLVSGSFIFKAADPLATIRAMKGLR